MVLQEATKREVMEETGLEFEPESLIYVEALNHWKWIRFTLAGKQLPLKYSMT